jgi:hypothetical protein
LEDPEAASASPGVRYRAPYVQFLSPLVSSSVIYDSESGTSVMQSLMSSPRRELPARQILVWIARTAASATGGLGACFSFQAVDKQPALE